VIKYWLINILRRDAENNDIQWKSYFVKILDSDWFSLVTISIYRQLLEG